MTAETPEKLEPLQDGRFCFDCRRDIECFTACCAKLNLKLTPYDIYRLSRRLEMRTSEFLDRYTAAIEEPGKLPRVALLMNDDDRRCPFVTDEGCSVYEDRPSACRTYPLARAASPSPMSSKTNEAYFLIREDHCLGHQEERAWTVDRWIEDQGLEDYYELNDLWAEIVTLQHIVCQSPDAEQKEKMFNLASYDLDTFREFVFKGGLLNRIELPERFVERLKTDDVALLRFACSWLRLALFGEMNRGLYGR